MKKYLALIVHLFLIKIALSQNFEDITPPDWEPDFAGNLIAGDLDNDGDLDLIQTNSSTFNIYENVDGVYSLVNEQPEFRSSNYVHPAMIDIGDYDRDGFLDIVQMGLNGPSSPLFHLLINNGNFSFTNSIVNEVEGHGPCAFYDFENDGDLDIFYSRGAPEEEGFLINNGEFISNRALFPGDWTYHAYGADFDRDGSLEFIQTETNDSRLFIGTFLLDRSDNDTLKVARSLSITQIMDGIEIADYDNDGDYDLLAKLSGWTYSIFDNINSDFREASFDIPNVEINQGRWTDLNNDGFYDIIFGGVEATFNNYQTKIYLNNKSGSFYELYDPKIVGSERSKVLTVDIDNDSDLDVIVSGRDEFRLFKNNLIEEGGSSNNSPDAPTNLSSSVIFSNVVLSWNETTDVETVPTGLSYNVTVVDEKGNIVVPSHSMPNGVRQIHKIGNAYNNSFYNLNCLKEGTYIWKVQALDASHQGSEFSSEETFLISEVAPAAASNLKVDFKSHDRVHLSWTDESSTESEYKIFRREVSEDVWVLQFPHATLPENSIYFVDSLGLNPDTEYEYAVVASNCSYPNEIQTRIEVKTYPLEFLETQLLVFDQEKVDGSHLELGDFDNDNDLDLLVSYSSSQRKTSLFRNDSNQFIELDIGLPFIDDQSSLQWIDLNHDNFLDIVVVNSRTSNPKVSLYTNQKDGSFTVSDISSLFGNVLDRIWQGGIVWADYDNDLDLDALIQFSEFEGALCIYENTGNLEFNKKNTALNGFIKSRNPFADVDRDGDLDFLVNLDNNNNQSYGVGIYINDGQGNFNLSELSELLGLSSDLLNRSGDMEWSDVNADGYPDIVLGGQIGMNTGTLYLNIYLNNQDGSFSPMNPNLTEVNSKVNVLISDFDNDGNEDFSVYEQITGPLIYRNRNLSFENSKISNLLRGTWRGTSTWGDIDADGDIDIVVAGQKSFAEERVILYTNTYSEERMITNDPPSSPSGLNSIVSGSSVELSWNHVSDDKTPLSALRSAILIVRNGTDTLIAPSSLENGYRLQPGYLGTINTNFLKVNNLQSGIYEWCVQSIDNSMSGSLFGQKATFVIEEEEEEEVLSAEKLETGFIVYPNPANYENLKIKLVNSYIGDIKLKITDLSGRFRHIRDYTNNTTDLTIEVDISGLESGVYILSISTNKEYIERIIVKK